MAKKKKSKSKSYTLFTEFGNMGGIKPGKHFDCKLPPLHPSMPMECTFDPSDAQFLQDAMMEQGAYNLLSDLAEKGFPGAALDPNWPVSPKEMKSERILRCHAALLTRLALLGDAYGMAASLPTRVAASRGLALGHCVMIRSNHPVLTVLPIKS